MCIHSYFSRIFKLNFLVDAKNVWKEHDLCGLKVEIKFMIGDLIDLNGLVCELPTKLI